jgi:hypothetical protein
MSVAARGVYHVGARRSASVPEIEASADRKSTEEPDRTVRATRNRTNQPDFGRQGGMV